MPFTLIRHKVADYLSWKFVFVEHAGARKVTGSRGGTLFRSADDPNEVVILMEWDDLANARAFIASPDLAETMLRAGVVGAPEIVYLDKVEQPSW